MPHIINMSDKYDKITLSPPKTGVFGTALQFISLIVGGGIIAVPYGCTAPGLKTGISISFTATLSMLVATHLFLRTKDIMGSDSLSELSYTCFGRPSIFIINLLITFVILGVMTLYLIIFAKISLSIIQPMVLSDKPNFLETLLNTKAFYIIAVNLFLARANFSKNLSELKL